MGNKNDTYNRIELRSEKIRHIIGTIPSALVRWSIAIIAIILLVLVSVVCFVPYPYGKGETIILHIFFF